MREGVGPEGVDLGAGMGFFPWGLVDQHFLQRGRFGRLVVALGGTGLRLGWGISEDSAIIVDRTTGWVEVIGRDGLALFDARALEASEGRFEGLRVSILGDGDRVYALTGEVISSPQAVPLAPQGEAARDLEVGELFAKSALSEVVDELARTTSRRALMSSEGDRALLYEDDETSSWRALSDPVAEEPCTAGLRLDLYRVSD
jgi:hypothetical protein